MLKMKKRILLAVTIAITAVIFIHSSMDAAASSEESGFILRLFERFAQLIGRPGLFTDHIIRKLAHFTEFAVFGFFLSWTVREYAGGFKGQIFKVLFFLLSVPVTDETIQYFSLGRSAEVKDVLLDFSGAVFGFLVIAALSALAGKIAAKRGGKAAK